MSSGTGRWVKPIIFSLVYALIATVVLLWLSTPAIGILKFVAVSTILITLMVRFFSVV